MNSSNISNDQLHSKDLIYEYDSTNHINNNINNNNMLNPINDLESLQMDYDENISELKEKLQISKDLRKKSEIERKALEHRILLLKNQEKFAILQFQNTKKKIEQILINRSQAEERMKQQSMSRKKVRNSRTYSLDFDKRRKMSKGNVFSNDNGEEQKDNLNCNSNSNKMNEQKERMKLELIEKLKEDEKERERLENEIANIEKEEFRLLQMLDEEENKN